MISFMGSQHCNPELHTFLEQAGFGDFQFHKWDSELMDRLEAQQLMLMALDRERHVLILVDDITLDHVEREKLAHLCVRGRHFHVSVMMLSVSYSTFHKSCRRSSDFVCLFNMGCQTDRELMMKEFAHKQHQCEFFMSQIVAKEHTAAILNLNEKQQNVYWYRAPTMLQTPTAAPCRTGLERTDHESKTAQSASGGDEDATSLQTCEPERTGRSEHGPGLAWSDASRTGAVETESPAS